ncbi:MAG: AAA family ATPase, partial [Alphaproteobacteria bacterium]
MKFTKLRLVGFKSFVDPAELVIEPGLTGVVGPNGCGKSNLVEALRWVMGENSAKRMRGDAMDDVIFSGSQNRSSRNLAEVSLTIENKDRSAPSGINDSDELEVVRAIERNSGSSYRINGHETRARDVQLLFADAASGAHSPSLISQGRIGEVINAKPQNRRALLEEAAGITGLHSRRHEAELRLRAAGNNLERLDDVMQALEAQLLNLKRQARQARRFRKVGEQIRHFDSIQLHLLFQRAEQQLTTAGEELNNANAMVSRLTEGAAQATNAHAEAADLLPDLRQTQAVRAAALHRLAVARDGLDQEEQRIAEASQQSEERLRQIEIDREREIVLGEEAATSMVRLAAEMEQIRTQQENEASAGAEAEARVATATTALAGGEGELQDLTNQVADDGAKADALQRAIVSAAQRIDRLSLRQEEAKAAYADLLAEIQDDDCLRTANDQISLLKETVAEASGQLERAESAHVAAEKTLFEALESGQQSAAAA